VKKRTTMIPQRIVFTLLSFLFINATSYAYGAGLISRFHPIVSVKEEYSDNLNLTKTNKNEDYITTVQPGIRFSNMDDKAGVNLDYALGAVFYGKKTNLNYISHNASLDVKYMTASHINFYLKESFIRSDEPREQEYFTTPAVNRYVLATTTERAVYWRNVVAPTIEYQFGPESRLGVNYRNNIYRTDSTSGENSQEHYINPFFSYWFDKRNGISLEYGLTYGEFDKNPDLTGQRANARYTYRFSPQYSIFAEYTYSKRTFDSSEPSTSSLSTDYDIHEPSIGMKFLISTALTASIQVGYFWTRLKTGIGKEGVSYKGELVNTDPRTTYGLSLQGGYTEDLFTAQNLGFIRYHSLTGFLNHLLDKQLSLGCFGSIEYAEYETSDRRDTIWGIGGRASYMPLKWLTLALEASHRENQSSVDAATYAENRGMFRVTVMY
jgi:hypothetical protein